MFNCNIFTSKNIRPRYEHVKQTYSYGYEKRSQMFINIRIRKIRNTYDSLFWFRYETFYYLFEFKVFDKTRERETQFLSMLTFPSDPTTCGTPPQTIGLASASSENQLPSSSVESQLSNSKILSPSLPRMTSSRPLSNFLSGVFIVTSMIVTSTLRAHEHLHSMCAPN